MAFSAGSNANDYTSGRKSLRTPTGPEICAVRYTIAMAAGDAALNTIGMVGYLPAGCVPVDLTVDMTDPDSSTAAIVMQVGIWDGSGANISTAAADGGAHWGVTQATTAAATQKLTLNGIAMASVTPTDTDRILGVKVTTAPTGAQAFILGVTLLYRAA